LGSALNLEDAFVGSGFPEGVFQCVIENSTAGESLIKSDIDTISVTGSINTGKRVAELASKNLKYF
jgi:acyl-CoA reductase-like NAD-dependent aldehyde dehydrogenase